MRHGVVFQKTRVPGLSCDDVCMILCLAVSVEHRLATDGRTDRHDDSLYPALASVARVKVLSKQTYQ